MRVFSDEQRDALEQVAEGVTQAELWGKSKGNWQYKKALMPVGMSQWGDWGVTDKAAGYDWSVYHVPTRWEVVSRLDQTDARVLVERLVSRVPGLLKGATQAKVASNLGLIEEIAKDLTHHAYIHRKP